MASLSLKLLTINDLEGISSLTQNLNPNLERSELDERQKSMFEFNNYRCFGFYNNEELIGISGAWLTVRLYSGKQLEIDNIILHPEHQSKGYGEKFLSQIEEWSQREGCKSVELNTYLENRRSHKFYHKLNYRILGFHFEKGI